MVNPIGRFMNAIGFGKPQESGSFDSAPSDGSLPSPKSVKIGSVGTEIYSGYFQEEYLDKLRGHKLAKEFDKMRRGDPQIKMLLRAVKNPILGAKWEVEPASDDPLDQKVAALISHILFNDSGKSFKKTLGEALSCIDFGHAPMEKTFKLVTGHAEFGTYHGIESLDLISQKTIEKWNFDSATHKLVSLQQIADGDLRKSVSIPSSDVMIFTLDMEGANYEGVSWLRSCYGNFFRKQLYLKLNGIGIEKFAVPTPVVKFPPGVQNDEQFDYVMAALEVYTSGQSNYLTMPMGYEMTLEKNAYDPELVEISIDKEDARMSKAFLANFLELGMSGTGAYALSNDLSDFFLSGLTHIADEIADVFNGDLIPILCRYNFGKLAKLPKLKHTGISDKAGKELAEVLDILIRSQVITPDDQLESSMRKKFDLPKASLIGQRKPAPANPFGGFGGAPAPAPIVAGSLSERIRKKLYG